MKHIILTRFNVLMPGWNSQINLDPKWLDGRFKLFEEICLPSVVSQTNQNFDWLVFFDSKTPQNYKEKINSLVKVFAFHPIYVDIFDLSKISAGLFKDYAEDNSMLLTSRLDSDDILATDYVEKLHSIASKQDNKCVINFDNGAILYSKNSKRSLYKYEDQSNPFTTLLEPFNPDLSTILAVKHTELHAFAEVVHVKGKPMWLQVVHGGNVSNRVRGTRVKLDQYNGDFIYMRSISNDIQESDFAVIFDNVALGTYRTLRDFIRSVLKRIYFLFKK